MTPGVIARGEGELEPQRLIERLATLEPIAAADPTAIRIIRAPGRVNLVGEHTDYNDGLVMPAAIDLEMRLALVQTQDRRVDITVDATGQRDGFDLDAVGPPRGGWIDYVAGTAQELMAAGEAVHGFRGLIVSSLPQGAGLSSSAALEIAAAWALAGPAGPRLDPLKLAQLAQRAENDYVGVSCGLMDQFAVANGVAGAALRFDCRSLAHRPVRLPLETHALVVIHTGSQRRVSTSAYNERRAQCERAVAVIAETDPGVRALRDVDEAMLERHRERLDPVIHRRARHVVTENARVIASEAALVAGDLPEVGRQWAASHASLRDDFEVSSPELDALVEIALSTPGVVAARMTGAGFGGCTVNLVARDATDRLSAAVEREYPSRRGLRATVIPVEPASGASDLSAGPSVR